MLHAVVLCAAHKGNLAVTPAQLGLHRLEGLLVDGVGADQELRAVVVEDGAIGE